MANSAQAITGLIVSMDGLAVARMQDPGMLNLRLPAQSSKLAPLAKLLGGALPDAPNRLATGTALRMARLGPDEWLLLCHPAELPEIEARMKADLFDTHHSLVDVSGNRACFRVAGSRADELLAVGCGLDLTDHALPANSCVQTVLAKAQVMILKGEGSSDFEIYPRRSFATYLAKWFVTAAEQLQA